MDIASIKTCRDYTRALEEIEGLMNARRGTRRGKRLDALVALVEAWEVERFPLGQAEARERSRRARPD
jgi:HTH-type transcriptional regulator/antitoxin HigA